MKRSPLFNKEVMARAFSPYKLAPQSSLSCSPLPPAPLLRQPKGFLWHLSQNAPHGFTLKRWRTPETTGPVPVHILLAVATHLTISFSFLGSAFSLGTSSPCHPCPSKVSVNHRAASSSKKLQTNHKHNFYVLYKEDVGGIMVYSFLA